MNPRILIVLVLVLVLFTKTLSLETDTKPASNITVMGTVFCDACSNNTFSKHSYFLKGVKVRVECSFIVNSTSKEDISIMVDRTTDKYGVYRLDIPPVDGFECMEGQEMESFCRATLTGSPSPLCNVPGLSSSTEHVGIKSRDASFCIYNLNALYYRPAKKDPALCGTDAGQQSKSLNSSLFFWPPFFPPFGFPWPSLPPFPFPFPSPPSFPLPLPPIPFFTPPPPSFPFPLPPWFSPPSPPSFPFPFPFTPAPKPPAFPFPPIPFLFPPPPPPPPSFPFPLPPFPPLTPIPFPPMPSLLPPPPPPPPSPPPPSFPWPFPPFPFPPSPPSGPKPGQPSPPPPVFSLRDPKTWFPSIPASPPNKP